MARCRAKTLSDRQCMNQSLHYSQYCQVHGGQKDQIAEHIATAALVMTGKGLLATGRWMRGKMLVAEANRYNREGGKAKANRLEKHIQNEFDKDNLPL